MTHKTLVLFMVLYILGFTLLAGAACSLPMLFVAWAGGSMLVAAGIIYGKAGNS